MAGMDVLRRGLTRLSRAVRYSVVLLAALAMPARRRFLGEVLALARQLPAALDQPLPAALESLTPAPAPQVLSGDTIRQIIDAATAFGAGRPLGICLRRSLLRYYFLRRAAVPVVVHFGARRLDDRIGGHAWLTLDGQPYHELPEHVRNYALMFSYPIQEGREGQPLPAES
jgi:hypothetical protein